MKNKDLISFLSKLEANAEVFIKNSDTAEYASILGIEQEIDGDTGKFGGCKSSDKS